MHDFLLAKEVVDSVLEIAEEKKLEKVSEVVLEIGMITMAHDNLDEHTEDISIENLEFGLKSISKNTILKNAKFKISKTHGESWKLVSLKD